MPEGREKATRLIVIDGAAGAGKSTLARSLAERFGLPYLNTGLMYRALALRALHEAVDVADGEALADLARTMSFSMDAHAEPPSLLIDGRRPGDELASPEVEAVVSTVSAHAQVRAVLRAEQRRLAAAGAVVEGRDIGTVVLPDADAKIFLRADPGARAARRQAERGTRDPRLAAALERRDALDARVNPLVPAHDAVVIETTQRDPEEVLEEAVGIVRASARGADGG